MTGSQSRESFTPGQTSDSSSNTRGKSRMHQRARTDPSGGRGATRVPTGTQGNAELEGVDSEEARASLYSTVHGAGRLFGRNAAKKRFTRDEMEAWLHRRGVLLIGADIDESPMAYRRLPDVLAE